MLTNKEIRALPQPKLTKTIKELVLQNIKCEHIAVITSNRIKNHKGYIVINAYKKDKNNNVSLFCRYIINGTDTRLYNIEKNKITTGYLDNFLGNYTITSTDAETNKLIKYMKLEVTNKTMSCIISSHSYKVSAYREKKRNELIMSNIDVIMKKVRKVPKDFEKTIDKTMTFSRYIFFNRKAKTGICSHCGSIINLKDLPDFKEKDKGICPVCNSKIIYRSEAKRALYKTNNWDTGTSVLIQKYSPNTLIARYFNTTYNYNDSPIPEKRTTEVIRTIIDFKNHKIQDYEWYYFKNYNGPRWCLPQKSMFNPEGLHYLFYPGEIYTKNLNTEFKKVNLNIIKEYRFYSDYFKKKFESKPYHNFSNAYHYVKYLEEICDKPYLEQISKIPMLNTLTCELLYTSKTHYKQYIDTSETQLHKVLKLKDKQQLRQCMEQDINFDNLKMIQNYNKLSNIPRTVKRILFLSKLFAGRTQNIFPLTDNKILKMEKYLNSLKDYPNQRPYIDYIDYIENCKLLNYNMKSELVLYPKDFKKAHDDAAINLKARKLEKEYEKIQHLLPDMHKKYDCECEKYLLRAPNMGIEITHEGQDLQHCVNGYVPSVANGNTVILFIRKKDNPEKPFVTMEVKNNKVIQVRGFSNCTPEQSVLDFVEIFKKTKLEQPKTLTNLNYAVS